MCTEDKTKPSERGEGVEEKLRINNSGGEWAGVAEQRRWNLREREREREGMMQLNQSRLINQRCCKGEVEDERCFFCSTGNIQ